MAKATKKSIDAAPSTVLPESYTLETGVGLLRAQGLTLRHKDLAAELGTSESIYKQLLQLPALIVYNQSLIDRTAEANEYLHEQIMNVVFAVNEVRANQPEIQSPLSEKRVEAYENFRTLTANISDNLFQLEGTHTELKDAVYNRLKSQIHEWQTLCYEAADKLTTVLLKENVDLPENFRDILAKHLQRAGINKIHPDELKGFKLKKQLSYAEQALVCALKEVKLA